MLRVISSLFILVCIQRSSCSAQEPKVNVSAYDGSVIAGYVDKGVFLNFTGPNLNLVHKNSKFIVGMLPSLRFKEDRGTPKNSFVTPSLGIGFTFTYKLFAVQVPLYYTTKTATQNGNWQIGIGVGLRLNALNTKK